MTGRLRHALAPLRARTAWPAALAAGLIATGSSSAALPSDPAGVPFVTYAQALAAGDAVVACDQLAATTLLRATSPPPPTLGAARAACQRALGAEAEGLDDAHRASLVATRVVQVTVKPGRARVTVQTTLFGIQPRATGTAVMEAGRWRIGTLASDAHVGSSYLSQVTNSSMQPALRVGDTILVDHAAYRRARPRIGDVVVFHPPAGAESSVCGARPAPGQGCVVATPRDARTTFLKRIVAGPGDRVAIRGGRVIRNGRRARESFVTPCRGRAAGCDLPRSLIVPAGRYYVLGDDRGASDDSRFWGAVRRRAIVGRVTRLGP